jgi:3',5'-cyclic AMP phosphodiesterase CpdA
MLLFKSPLYFAGIAVSMILSVSCAGSAKSKQIPAQDTLSQHPPVLYITNDIHYLSPFLHDDGPRYESIINQRDGKFTEFIDPVFQTFVQTAINDKPDIVLVNGDLTFNGEKTSHNDLAAAFAQIEKTGTKVYVIPGNHDINNPSSAFFFDVYALEEDMVSPADFKKIYRNFGYGEALSRDKTTLSYIAEPVKGLRLLMIDSCMYKDNMAQRFSEPNGKISDATKKWIQTNVRKAQQAGCTVVAAMHHSSMDHHPMVNEHFTVANSDELRSFLYSLGINFILTGHIHAQSASERSVVSADLINTGDVSAPEGIFYDIATSALAVYPHQFGVLRRLPDSSWHYSVKPLDVESWAKNTGKTDERLFVFSSLAEAFFARNAQAMVKRRIGDTLVTEAEFDDLTDLISAVNKRYFAGTATQNGDDVFNSPGYSLMQSGRFESLARYVSTIIEDTPPNNVDVTIPSAR